MSSLNPLGSSFMTSPQPPKPYFEFRTKIVMICIALLYLISLIFLIIKNKNQKNKNQKNKNNTLGIIIFSIISILSTILFVIFPLNCMIKGEQEGGTICTIIIGFIVSIYVFVSVILLIMVLGGFFSTRKN